ncbi:hypothetical protein MA16_Dca013660 [Dendrobium catenatum]|uniref:Transposase MuDR plant domain-containing protein n=1 Tax=Dendrobium catenatum TaxID=906689 RepID=A0A2I0WB27_9ASPA|nr:hypothetical protein MA16_Dca013660 [Dendrobium catenatum]
MLESSYERNKIEVVVAMKYNEDDLSQSQDIHTEMHQFISQIRDNNDIVVNDLCNEFFISQSNEENTLLVGSRFEDSQSFKQAVRSNAILQNYAIRIKASDKSRIIISCAYRGCAWRVRASLCHDGHSFEVRKLETSHLCPGVNRAGKKQATTTWVAHEIKDIVKKNPEITPKEISNNLETSYGLSLPYMKLWRSREFIRCTTVLYLFFIRCTSVISYGYI